MNDAPQLVHPTCIRRWPPTCAPHPADFVLRRLPSLCGVQYARYHESLATRDDSTGYAHHQASVAGGYKGKRMCCATKGYTSIHGIDL